MIDTQTLQVCIFISLLFYSPEPTFLSLFYILYTKHEHPTQIRGFALYTNTCWLSLIDIRRLPFNSSHRFLLSHACTLIEL